jgi:hypothetical protein
MTDRSDSSDPSDPSDYPVYAEYMTNLILRENCPSHIAGKNLDELTAQMKAVIGLGRMVDAEGTNDRMIYELYTELLGKFNAYFPELHYKRIHYLVRTARDYPDQMVLYDVTKKFGMSMTKLKKHKMLYIRYMRTQKIKCPKCLHTKRGTAFSDQRIVGRKRNRICDTCR